MKEFRCQNCKGLIKPPEILPPKVLGNGIGTFKIEIHYTCPKCAKPHHTEVKGSLEMQIKVVEKQKR